MSLPLHGQFTYVVNATLRSAQLDIVSVLVIGA